MIHKLAQLAAAAVATVLALPLIGISSATANAEEAYAITAYASHPELVTIEQAQMVYSPVQDRIYVQRSRSNVAVLNPHTLAIEGEAAVGSVLRTSADGQLVADPRRGWIYQNRSSSAWPRVLVPGGDNLPVPYTPDLGEVVRGQRRMAIEPDSGALYMAVSDGGPIVRMLPVGDDPGAAASFEVTRFQTTLKVDSLAMVSATTAVAALVEPVDGSPFALLTFDGGAVAQAPVPFDGGPVSNRDGRVRVAALGDGCFAVAQGTRVRQFCLAAGGQPVPAGQVLTMPYPLDAVVADQRTKRLFVANDNRNAIRVHAIRDGQIIATGEHGRPGVDSAFLALDGTGGAVAGSVADFIRFSDGEPATPPAPDDFDPPVVLDQGHLDVAPILTGGGLRIYVKDGSRFGVLPRWIPLERTVWHLKPLAEARQTVTEGSPLAPYLGPPGTGYWQLPMDNIPGLLWPGWSSEQNISDLEGNSTVQLTGYEGPGAFTLSDTEAVRLASTDLDLVHRLPASSHAHSYWSFGAAGVYRLTLTVNATTLAGEPVRTTATVAIAVGDIDPTTVTPGTGLPDSTPTPSPTLQPTATSTPGPTLSPTLGPTQSPSPGPGTGGGVVLDSGHVDINSRVDSGRIELDVKDGTNPSAGVIWRDMGTVVFHVRPEARTTVPNDAAYAFLGTAGDALWLLPQTQDTRLLWPGWNTEEVGSSDVDGSLTWELTKVTGPGRFALFQNTFQGPGIVFNSADGVPDALAIPAGTHAHGAWAFGQQGVYRLTFTMSATLATGQRVSTTETLAVAVGDVDPTQVRPGEGGQAEPSPSGTPSSPSTQPTATGTAPQPTTPQPAASVPVAAENGMDGLPKTGMSLATLLLAGLALVCAGALTVQVARRRG
ncbi:choice-of-anchor M domain-containing protein [Micromonospora sp. CPCC 205371]|nr:choice-of-anchor M domain-containing protein [Micromonospora sp. CPCC 205371]